MAVESHWSGTKTVKGITYTIGQKFTCAKTSNGTGNSEGGGGSAVAIQEGTEYIFAAWAEGDAVVHPYLVRLVEGYDRGWHKAEIFPEGSYTVKYNKGSYGSGTNQTATKKYEKDLTLKGAIFTRTGYTQKGWSSKKSGSTKKYNLSATYTANSDITLYPYWVANTYTITYNLNGGSGSIDSQSYTYSTTKTITLSSKTPTRTNYTFLGWATSKTATKAKYSKGSSFKRSVASNTTLYAVWSQKEASLHIRPAGGIWDGSEGYSVIDGNAGEITSIQPPTRAGYKFVGWFKTAKGSLSNELTTASLFTNSEKNPTAYTNKTDGTVSFTTHDKEDLASTAGDPGGGFQKIIKMTTTNRTSEEAGGFVLRQTPVAGATYTHVMCAKAPENSEISIAHNAITGVDVKTGQGIKWLTSNKGTGNWERYAYELTVPSTATTLGTFGHIYLTTENTNNVTWYVAGNQITKSVGSAQSFKFSENGDTYIYAQWVPQGLVKIYLDDEDGWVDAIPYVYKSGTWKRAEPYVYKGSKWVKTI